jgi:glycosyltransferase involved in cell wall biosynthesis
MKRLTLQAPINTFTGYGQYAIEIVRGMEKLGVHVAVRAFSREENKHARIPQDIKEKMVNGVQPEKWELLLSSPGHLPTPGKNTVQYTMWESTRLPRVAVEMHNRCSCVILPNQWNAGCYSACGVNVPIKVVRMGVDTSIFNLHGHIPYEQKERRCIFGAAGRPFHGVVRKGLDDVIEAFLRAFPKEQDVELRIKSFDECFKKAHPDPRIVITNGYLDQAQMAGWYSGITCFVSAAKAEGWGLHQQEAMCVGRAVMAPIYGGLMEFMSEECSYPVEFDLVPAEQKWKGLGDWCKPRMASMVEQMRRVYENPIEAEELGTAAYKKASKLTIEKSILDLYNALDDLGAI